MNPSLLALVGDRVVADGVAKKSWAAIVSAACDGQQTLEALLSTGLMPEIESVGGETSR